jgi:DNA-binding transcriptional regulator YhcF (GntR family)
MAQSPAAPLDFPLAELPLSEEEAERTALVDFAIEREGELPLGTQLEWKIRGMIVRGALRPGDRVPSVRELADFAGVNVNTARAVYRSLEGEGLIASEQGRGTFVAPGAYELTELQPIAARAVAEARERGLDPRALAAAIYSERPEGEAPPAMPFPPIDMSGDSLAIRAALREQIGRLEREIANYAWHDPSSAPEQRPRGAEPVGRVAGVDELERTRAELIDRLRRLRGEATRRGSSEAAVRAHVERMVSDPAEHRWEMVGSEAVGEPGCTTWRVVPAWGPVGAIMGWWRVKVSSGCPLAAPLAAATGGGAGDDQSRSR